MSLNSFPVWSAFLSLNEILSYSNREEKKYQAKVIVNVKQLAGTIQGQQSSCYRF